MMSVNRKRNEMSYQEWKKEVTSRPGAAERISEIETAIRIAQGLPTLRRHARLTQSDVAKRLGVSQPRVAAIEKAGDLTLGSLSRYVQAVGGRLHISVEIDGESTELLDV